MLDAFEQSGAGKLILLGDILYHGPRNDLPDRYAPKQVIISLVPYADRILCVRGNCDAEVDQMVLPFPILADYAALFIDELSPRTVYVSHGHHPMPPLSPGDIWISGHTHIPLVEQGDVVHLNPGSVAIPKGGAAPSYMLYEGKTFTILDFEGNAINKWSAA